MAEAEEIRSRIETIKDLSDRLAEQDRTIKDLEEEMRSETPEHPWSFMKMRRHNRLHAEIEDEQTSMSRDRYDLNRLTERLFEDVNIIADKATSTNSLELILDLVEQSLDTDPNYRENVRKQAGVTDGMSYMRLVPQDNPKGMLPPTPWGRDAAEEAYRQHQVRQIDPRLIEKDKLMSLAQEIQARVFTDADQLRHEESMHMAEKQYTAQTNSVLIQQQMLANQQAQAAQPASVQTLAQAEQTQPSE